MKKAIFGFIYYKVLGWKAEVHVPDYDKYIICAAPHTTNWDLFIGKLFYGAIGRDSGFMLKMDWFFWPLGPFFRWMGGIAVDRGKKTSLVDQLVQIAKESKTFTWPSLRKVPAKQTRTGRKVSTTLLWEQTFLSCWQALTIPRRPSPSVRKSARPVTSTRICVKSNCNSRISKVYIRRNSLSETLIEIRLDASIKTP